ncbi:MAG: hypothetical protein WED34_18355 [Planctomycetales bacterium]
MLDHDSNRTIGEQRDADISVVAEKADRPAVIRHPLKMEHAALARPDPCLRRLRIISLIVQPNLNSL